MTQAPIIIKVQREYQGPRWWAWSEISGMSYAGATKEEAIERCRAEVQKEFEADGMEMPAVQFFVFPKPRPSK